MDPPEIIATPANLESSIHRHYLIKWKLAISMQVNGRDRIFHGWIGEISTVGATAYTENNLAANSRFFAQFLIPSKSTHEHAKVVQVDCKSTYCVLDNNGMFRVGLKFAAFSGNGLAELEKELTRHIALKK